MGATRHAPELVDAILEGWRGGESYGAMAKRFSLTKGSVAGIVYYNRGPGEESAPSFLPPRSAPDPAPKRLEHHSGGHMPTGRTVVHTAKMVSGFNPKTCQWIAGEPSADDACKCGAATGASRVYCPAHEARAWYVRRSEEAA